MKNPHFLHSRRAGLTLRFSLHFAFCILHFAFILSFPDFLLAQQTPVLLLPSGTLTNQTHDTLFFLPKQKLETLMDRDEINAQLFAALENRVELCDSALQLKTREAECWYGKLLETDGLLEDMEIRTEKQIHRRKVLTKIWFGAGVILGWVVCLVI